MNAIAITLVLAATLVVTSVFTLIRALSRAEPGYEDETGFHHGSAERNADHGLLTTVH